MEQPSQIDLWIGFHIDFPICFRSGRVYYHENNLSPKCVYLLLAVNAKTVESPLWRFSVRTGLGNLSIYGSSKLNVFINGLLQFDWGCLCATEA